MQVQLSINGRDFLALLDSGSTHNFIDLETTAELNLQQTPAPHSIKVAVANGDQISNVGIYNSLPIQIDTEQFIIDCYSIKLGGYDFVLGINWLSSLGPIIWDFNNLTMKFWRNGRRIIWKPEHTTQTTTPSDIERTRLHRQCPTSIFHNFSRSITGYHPKENMIIGYISRTHPHQQQFDHTVILRSKRTN
jgi:hypothetical protein